MTKITYIGDDESCIWGGMILFVKGEPVEVSDPHVIMKARKHPQFRVDEEENHEQAAQGSAKTPTQDETYNWKQGEKTPGYKPVKKKVKKRKERKEPKQEPETKPEPTLPTSDNSGGGGVSTRDT